MQAHGGILIGGQFTGLGGGTGSTPRSRIGRLNPDGSLDAGFDPGANGDVWAFAVRPDGRVLVGGAFTSLGGGGTGTIRPRLGQLNADGSLDGTFDVTANDVVYALALQPDGRAIVAGNFTEISRAGATSPAGRLVRVHADATIDATFTTSADQVVFAVTVQSDDKAIVGGTFTTLSSDGRAPATRNKIGRLYWDGSVEVDFNPGPSEVIGSVSAIALQPDGKMLVSGHFTSIAGQNRQRVARLNADGSLDSSFSAGANGYVGAIAVQPDGKIVVGGFFTQLSDTGGAVARQNIGRLNPDGSVDGSFDPQVTPYAVGAIAIQPDGKIVIGGLFSHVNGEARSRLARLNPDGSLDPAFNPGANNDGVYAVALQPDGKILVVGHFTSLGGGGGGTTTRNRIGRLNSDGSLDAAFDPGANDYIGTIGLQVDGKIVVGGRFTMLGGGGAGNTARNFIGRLHADGSIDGAFDAGADARAHALVVLPDGKVVVSGDFATLGGGGLGTAPRPRIGRVTNTTGAFQNLSVSGDGRVVTWLRSGAAAELWRATFESSADGVIYTTLGTANRTGTGWQLAGQNLPTDQNLFVRARGYLHAARSVSLVESIRLVTIAPDVAQPFTDEVLISGVTPIRTVHITELRTRIDSQRARFGLGGFAWADEPLTPGTIVRAVHVTELRIALQQAYAAAGVAAPAFTDPTLIPGILTIKRVHIQELRDSVVALEGN